MELPDELELNQFLYLYIKDENDPNALKFVETYNEVLRRIKEGLMYVKFIDGDRNGSISKVELDPKFEHKETEIRFSCGGRFHFSERYFDLICKWDKRKNSCKLCMPNQDAVFLTNYAGPTIYELFDAKTAKEKVLENPNQRDLDGNVLNIGDPVLYINARYGGGFKLDYGRVKEFHVVANSRTTSITTIIQKKDSDELSQISYPENMIKKLTEI